MYTICFVQKTTFVQKHFFVQKHVFVQTFFFCTRSSPRGFRGIPPNKKFQEHVTKQLHSKVRLWQKNNRCLILNGNFGAAQNQKNQYLQCAVCIWFWQAHQSKNWVNQMQRHWHKCLESIDSNQNHRSDQTVWLPRLMGLVRLTYLRSLGNLHHPFVHICSCFYIYTIYIYIFFCFFFRTYNW